MSNKNIINIALSADTILYFPFYLLSKHPEKYGFVNSEINLINKQGDKEAYEALGDDCDYAVCDPMVAKTHLKSFDDIKNINKKMIKPIILKTGLWGISNDETLLKNGKNSTLLNKMESCTIKPLFKNICTYSDSTSASKVLSYLVEYKEFKQIPIDRKIHSRNFGDEFTIFLENEPMDMIVTCDILAVKILENNRNNDIYTIINFSDVKHMAFDVLRKNVFTALSTSIYRLDYEDTRLIVNAIDKILKEFYEIEDIDDIAKEILDYHNENNIFLTNEITRELLFFENRTEERRFIHKKDISDALEILRKEEFYPKESRVPNLREYWKNSCIIWNNDKNHDKIGLLGLPKKRMMNNCFYKALWEKKDKSKIKNEMLNKVTGNWIIRSILFIASIIGVIKLLGLWYKFE